MTEPSTDLVPREVVVPVVGQVLSLDSPTVDLGAALDDVRDIESEFRTFKRAVTEEVLRRMDFQRAWTLREGDFKLEGDGPNGVDYDGAALARTLAALVDEGLIPEAAALAACKTETVYKPMKRGIDALVKTGGEVAERVRACGEEAPAGKRRVRVTRERPK